jgi:hypothetical protein
VNKDYRDGKQTNEKHKEDARGNTEQDEQDGDKQRVKGQKEYLRLHRHKTRWYEEIQLPTSMKTNKTQTGSPHKLWSTISGNLIMMQTP